MKILLRDLRNGHFCKGPSEWTRDRNEALDFLTSDDAIRFARQHRLVDVQVVAQFRDDAYQIQIPYCFDVVAGA
jgi:hypothetical protein